MMMPSFMYAFSLVACILSVFNGVVTASNVIELTPANFDEIVGSGKPALVEFFAPWCGHCKSLAPVYEQLADAYQHAKDQVVIAKVDADAHRQLGERFGVSGFPTLKWFNGKASDPEDYRSGRDLESLTGFIAEKAGLRAKAKKGEPSNVVTLKDSTFDEIVMDAENDVLVKFYAPWCGHCKNLAPVWESLAKTFTNEKNVVIAKIDAEAETNVAETYGISSYPQIKFFPKGSSKKEAFNYEKGRTEKDFVDFLNEKAGTHRLVGGALSDKAGRIVDLDELAKKLATATTKEEEGYVYTELEQVLAKLASSDAKYYAKVFEKVKTDPKYPMNEKHRLEAVVAKGNIASEKIDNFKTRINILSAFDISTKGMKHEEL